MNGTLLKKVKYVFEHVKRHWLTLSFIFGFICDNILLHRIDQTQTNAILLFYLLLTMVSNILLYAGISERFGPRVNIFFKEYAPVAMQFAFGGVLSGMLIFYSRSGSLIDSWPFLLFIIGVIYGNETIKDRGTRLVYNLSMFFVGLFAYVVLIIPVILGKMGALIFVGSGFVALMIMYWFFIALTKVVPNFIALQRKNVVFSIGIIYMLFNFFYFTNIIPPIPLALKELGIYNGVIRFDNDTYQLTYEKPEWWQFYLHGDDVFHASVGDNIFCYASIFAPTKLATNIYHHWEYYDATQGSWTDHGRYQYPIFGGRGEGFRGYTMISNYQDGKWRCTVETERGQSLGRTTFSVVHGEKGELVTKVE